MNKLKHLSLVILDGLGERENCTGNAYCLAKTPFLDFIKKTYPSILINASGKDVGLPKGQMGNSEVGHLNIGSGRVIKQSLVEIDEKLNDSNFLKNDDFKKLLKHLKKHNSNLHLFGLTSDGGIHSSINHLLSLTKILKELDQEFYLHFISDGRDCPPNSSPKFIKILLDKKIPIASISGRYYAMDRDRRWERIQLAYDAIALAKGKSFQDPLAFINESYQNDISDEFIIPGYNQNLKVKIKDHDAVIFFNFRADRIRQFGHMLVDSNRKESHYDYDNKSPLKDLFLLSFREIIDISTHVLFPTEEIKDTLGDILEKNNISQIRAAETEKYPHVTFFMDGGKLLERKGQLKILVPSPKVATYDLQPEMSAIPLTEKLLKEIPNYQGSLINFANPDMVGHSGKLTPTIKAVETVDQMLAKLYHLIVDQLGGIMMITADHGNAETIIDDQGKICTTHTTNPVRLILTSREIEFKEQFLEGINGRLSDLAPTFLKILDIKQSKKMNGRVLIK